MLVSDPRRYPGQEIGHPKKALFVACSNCCKDTSWSVMQLVPGIDPYLCGGLLVRPEWSIEHDNPVLIEGEGDGVQLLQTSTPCDVFNFGCALPSQCI